MTDSNSGLNQIMGLDIGDKRIGVAVANYSSKLPRPVATLANDDSLVQNLKSLIAEHKVNKLVIGLPRSLDGNTTDQTIKVQAMAGSIKESLNLPTFFQDEALSSVRAKEDLERHRGHSYSKEDVDKLAACYILEDYLAEEDNV